MQLIHSFSTRSVNKIILLVFVCLCASHSFCQTDGKKKYAVFFGTIKSASDSSSVEYADIYLSGKTIGTISNSGGEFEIKIPDSLAIDDLLISSVGYKTKSIALKKKSLGTIYLEPQTMILKEVVVTANRVDSSFNILKLLLSLSSIIIPGRIIL